MPPRATVEPLCLAIAAMGTRFELVLPEVPTGAAAIARLRAAGEAALDEIRQTDARWSLFRRDSFLAHLVASAHAAPVRLDEDDWELLDAARRAYDASRGAFDPCAVMGAGSFEDVELDAAARAVRFRAPGLALDLGGVAKGHALDRAARVLREAGVRSALLHGGTSAVCALGAPPESGKGSAAGPSERAGWRVRLGAADDAPEARLADMALAVSAALGHRDSRPRAHVVDPRRTAAGVAPTAAVREAPPAPLEASAVALPLAADAAPLALADALATALLVTGAPLAARSLPACTQVTKSRGAPWRFAVAPLYECPFRVHVPHETPGAPAPRPIER